MAGAAVAAAAALLPRRSWALPGRVLRMYHTHTHERVELPWPSAEPDSGETLAALDRFLRDHYDGSEHPIDCGLLALVAAVLEGSGCPDSEVHVISGYRSPATNEKLRRRSAGVARSSLHMRGMAIDLRIPGTSTSVLRDTALGLARGGVGYYGAADFVHLDTGRVRRW